MRFLLKSIVNLFVIIFLIIACATPENNLPEKQFLHENWQFKNIEDSVWLPASVPGNVFTDLLDNHLIPHPFVSNNEMEVQWVSKKSWEYKTAFSLDKKTLSKMNKILHFEGLDTYASVYLNGNLLLETNNAFRHWQVDVSSVLSEKNVLKIIFFPTASFENNEKEKLNYTLPEGNRIFTRKAQFQYGWDWGPKLNTSGIWKDIYLESYNNIKTENVYIKQKDLTDETANLIAEIEVNSFENEKVSIEVLVNNLSVKSEGFRLKSGKNKIEIPFNISHPKRWWTHNLGEPYLYDISILVKHNQKIVDSFFLKKGLRTIELVTEKDDKGETFYFKLNGEPVFIKGANYIPQNSFQNWVTNSHYEKLLNDVVEANMNMLRIWGGGIYENDVFYELCDKKGILVWQDFMFACAMYPGDEAFLENVTQEAIDNVKRLRNHSSIALWCGNNESSEGWHRWGWQDSRSESEKVEIWSNYLKIFDSILPNIVNELTDIPYWESSPKFGRGDARYKTEGDAHDWWIWHDGHPFENLEKNVPRFMSEFGFQSFPSYEAIRYINSNDSISITSKAFKTHQKHSRGFDIIAEYMQRDFPAPKNDEDYVYMSQLLQAYGIGKGIEAQRRAKPYTMGSLYWQLNDCWPVVSWSSIDFFGNWKALHYQARHSFKDLLISFEKKDENLKVFVVNDLLEPKTGILELKIMDFAGNILWQSHKEIIVEKNNSAVVAEIPLSEYKAVENRIVITANFEDEESLFYLVKPKDLALKKLEITKTIHPTENGFNIELSSETLQKNVFLYSDVKGHFSDNYFDLLPNRTKTIHFRTENDKMPDIMMKIFNYFIR